MSKPKSSLRDALLVIVFTIYFGIYKEIYRKGKRKNGDDDQINLFRPAVMQDEPVNRRIEGVGACSR
jgi:hypothetical protein